MSWPTILSSQSGFRKDKYSIDGISSLKSLTPWEVPLQKSYQHELCNIPNFWEVKKQPQKWFPKVYIRSQYLPIHPTLTFQRLFTKNCVSRSPFPIVTTRQTEISWHILTFVFFTSSYIQGVCTNIVSTFSILCKPTVTIIHA